MHDEQPSGARHRPLEAETLAPVPILIVDDKPANVMALRAVLESPEYELVGVHSGQEACDQVRQRTFAVILLDVRMPAMGGLETAARIRQLAEGGPTIPIVFVTAMDEAPSHALRAYGEGAVDFIQKPIPAVAIRGKVAVFAELYRARRQLALEQARSDQALQRFTDLAVAFAGTRTPEEVASVIVDQGMRVAGADTCSVYVLDEAETTLELIGHCGVAPEIVEKTRRIRESHAPSVFVALRGGRTAWVETAKDYARIHPELANTAVRGTRPRAFWSAPLIVEGRPFGLLGMGFYDERRFPARERSLVDALAKQCGQALLRATRRGREDRARAWLTTTLRSIGDGVIATDAGGAVVFMNPLAEQLTGWTEAEARGRALEEVFAIFSEETRAPCESPVANVLRDGKVVGLANHTVLRSRHGAELPIADSAAPIRDASGELFGVVLVFRDVATEKREQIRREFLARAGAALASSLDYRATLATVTQLAVPELADWCEVSLLDSGALAPQQVAVAHADPDKVQWARDLGERYPPDPDASTGAPQVIRSGKSELYPELPWTMLEAAAQDDNHLRIIRELKLESAMIVPLRGRDRTLGAMTFIYADSGRRYTEQDLGFAEEFARRAAMAIENARALRQAEDARAQESVLRREADLANRSKDEFLATVSHELRTPLNAILGWAVTLRGRKPAEELDRALAIIERNARRQAHLLEDVLDMSRIISGKLTLSLGPTDIAEAIQGAMETVTSAAAAKEIHIRCDADASIIITADADRLQQVVWNLLANAIKFTPKGGEVSVRAHREGADVSIRITDNGEGIPPEALSYIFEPFRQADASTTRKQGGLGLGLAIVRQLVAAHGGTVHAASEGLGRGASFVVTLPAPNTVVPIGDSAPASASMPSTPAVAPRLEGLSVLVVDDEEDARGIVEQILLEHGASVTTAASAREAMSVLAAARPEVIVSDIGMPEMDGYAFIRTVRILPVGLGGRTPAVALSAYARREDVQRALAAGFQMHLTKPVLPTQLVTMVANAAGLSLTRPTPSS